MTDRVLSPGGKHGRKCRACGREKLIRPGNGRDIYPTYPWGDADLCDRATLICPFCKAGWFAHGVRRGDGGTAYWVRTVSTSNRAYQLSQSYDRKGRDECHKRITDGEATAADPGDLE